ncbi:stage II sporulation protein M, partial [Gottfriedia acidiceleris]|uniref:stage II sporulation protein M n=1 Tax=Gottfriedia acidiceleris TaxID=371036 RepID=UPI003000F483
SDSVYKNIACKPENVFKIFSNNLMAVIFYIIPILGVGKLLIDLYITVGSLKIYILQYNFENTLFLFFPHFLFELYAMTIWVYMSWVLFRDIFIEKKLNYTNYIKLIFFSIVLLIISATIEATERCFF